MRTWVGGGGNSGLADGRLTCGLATVFCIPDSRNQQLWSVLVCSHMPVNSICARTQWGRFALSYDHTMLFRIQNTSTEVLHSRFHNLLSLV